MQLAPELTQLIAQAASGDEHARALLYERAYPELRRIAHSRLYRHDGRRQLQTTELLSESFLRFVNSGAMRAQDRAQFFALASSIMRSVIFDAVRAENAQKRGAGDVIALDTEIMEQLGVEQNRFMEIEQAMKQLEKTDARLAQVVDMRYFGGLEWAEIATVLNVNARTVRRDWDKAQLLLRAILS